MTLSKVSFVQGYSVWLTWRIIVARLVGTSNAKLAQGDRGLLRKHDDCAIMNIYLERQ